ncbi:MAG: FG-GAP-like repeat-containing protein [Flavobacteriaceae bacterium]|nr:FG-GAP-like repeat-containing protein [Flavobacteriaceae bacterium]
MKALYFISFVLAANFCNAQVLFEEKASQLGLDNSSYGTGILGGGISFYDFDNDGWDDLTLATEDGSSVRFFKNNQGLFEEVFFNITNDAHQIKTVQWVDINNNGQNDFFVTFDNSANRLYKNLGNMVFEDITVSSGLFNNDHVSFGASWGDVNNDGFLDVLITSRNVVNTDEYNLLFLNNGDETFTDITVSAGLELENYLSFCAAFFDYDKDGYQDIYIANDKFDTSNLLYKNNGDNTFTNVSEVSGTDIMIDAMSTTIDDYNNDGWLDIYITNTPLGNVLYRNNGDGTFTDVADDSGTTFDSVGWGAAFLDADNDGFKDLHVVGEVFNSPNFISSAFYHNNGDGTFTIPTDSGIFDEESKSFSNAIGDSNNDGFPDIAVLNFSPSDNQLWENNTPQSNNWLKVKLQGTESNRQGIGSWIEIAVGGEQQYNYTLLGEGFLGQNSASEFFGIGDATAIDYVKVTWLSGIVDYIENPDINEQILIIEGEHPLSIDDFQAAYSTFQVYPNPSKNKKLTVNYIHFNETSTELEISTVLGQVLKTIPVTQEKTALNLSEFSSGLYFFTLKNEFSEVTKRVVID